MSNTKTKMTDLTIQNVDPRTRMLEVRAIVAKAVKDDQRVDLIGFIGDDIARSQIALQDLLTKETTKRAKANAHIVTLKGYLNLVSDHTLSLVTEHTSLLMKADHMKKEIHNSYDECARLSKGWKKANKKLKAMKVLVKK